MKSLRQRAPAVHQWTTLALAGLLLVPMSAGADDGSPAGADVDGRGPGYRRGPLGIRDEHLLAQPRLTLPAVAPRTTSRGHWALDVDLLWSSSFSWAQDVRGEDPEERHFLVDGETLTLGSTVRLGLGDDVDAALRVPVRHRGGGVLDRFIDAWHRLLNLGDGARPSFLRDAFRVEGATTDGLRFSWNQDDGWGLGDIELALRWRVLDGDLVGPSVALVGRLSLPTGTRSFEHQGPGAGAQVVAGLPLGRTWDLYAGLGATVQDPGPVGLIEYQPARAHGFAALEWRPWTNTSLTVETNAASRLVTNVRYYPGVHWMINAQARIDLSPTLRLDLGLTENLIHQQATTDLAFSFGIGWRSGDDTIQGHGQAD